jgi:hypothetical protein
MRFRNDPLTRVFVLAFFTVLLLAIYLLRVAERGPSGSNVTLTFAQVFLPGWGRISISGRGPSVRNGGLLAGPHLFSPAQILLRLGACQDPSFGSIPMSRLNWRTSCCTWGLG